MGLLEEMRAQGSDVPCPSCKQTMHVTVGNLMDNDVVCPHCSARGDVEHQPEFAEVRTSIAQLRDTLKLLGG